MAEPTSSRLILNDALLALIQNHGLTEVVNGLDVACARLASFAYEQDNESLAKVWETNQVTVGRILPMIIEYEEDE